MSPYDFDKKNELNFFVRTVTLQGEQRIYWGKDFPRALEEAGVKVGDSITATRVASKPVTVETGSRAGAAQPAKSHRSVDEVMMKPSNNYEKVSAGSHAQLVCCAFS
jgi:hypothetical protein